MDQVIGSGCEPVSGSVENPTNELAEVHRVTARLLLTAVGFRHHRKSGDKPRAYARSFG